MKRILILLLFLLSSALASAQGHSVGGTVTSASDGVPLPGVVIQVQNDATRYGVTNRDGVYRIDDVREGEILVFTLIGYATQARPVTSASVLDVALAEESTLLDETVVIGYGTVKKSDLSGAVSQIKSEELLRGGAIDIAHGLQGKVAGVEIQQSDGAPGGGMSILVRGANSFTTSSQPLIIVDGIPVETGATPANAALTSEQASNPLSFINPHDIETMEILKDASATAIYGSRGANGVVIITTRRGRSEKPVVELTVTAGTSSVARTIPVLDAHTYARYINEQYDNSLRYEGAMFDTYQYSGTWAYPNFADGHPNYSAPTYSPSPEDFLHPGYRTDEYGNRIEVGCANWQDEIFQRSFSTDYNLSVSGGNDQGFYAFSGNYARQSGTIRNSGYSRYALRANIGRHINAWLELGSNSSFTNALTDFANTLSYNTGVIRSAIIFPPVYGADMDTTTADNINWLAANPAAYVRNAKDQLRAINFYNSSYLEIKLFPALRFRQNLGLGYSDQQRGAYYDRHTQEGFAPRNGLASRSTNQWNSLTSESLLQLDKAWGVHSVNAVAGFTAERSSWKTSSILASNFPDDLTQDNDLSRALDKPAITTDTGTMTLASFLGRVNYTLKGRYLLTASVRSDGSSKFAEGNKWASFLSGALAWKASEEPFIKKLNLFSNLKLRASYGETGNQGISSYRSIAMLSTANYPFGGSMNSGSALVLWRGPVSSDIRWETTRQYNLGVDMAFLADRISLTVDFYDKRTRDLLQEIQIPSSTGFGQMLVNSGSVRNTGLEFTLHALPISRRHFNWTVDGNLSLNRNRIGGLSGDQFARSLWYAADDVFIQRNGLPIGAMYGYVEDGFYDNEAEVRADPQWRDASASTVLSKLGEIKYRDLDGDGQITARDRTVIGDANPDFTFGLTNTLGWKAWSLSFLLQGCYGNDIFNGTLWDIRMGNIGNITQDAYDTRWTEENKAGAKWPKATRGYTRSFLLSDRYIEDGSYIKLKTVQLSYRWTAPFKGVGQILFTLTGGDLLTLTRYSGYDPDVNAFGSDTSRRGVDIYSYPTARSFAAGVSCTF